MGRLIETDLTAQELAEIAAVFQVRESLPTDKELARQYGLGLSEFMRLRKRLLFRMRREFKPAASLPYRQAMRIAARRYFESLLTHTRGSLIEASRISQLTVGGQYLILKRVRLSDHADHVRRAPRYATDEDRPGLQ